MDKMDSGVTQKNLLAHLVRCHRIYVFQLEVQKVHQLHMFHHGVRRPLDGHLRTTLLLDRGLTRNSLNRYSPSSSDGDAQSSTNSWTKSFLLCESKHWPLANMILFAPNCGGFIVGNILRVVSSAYQTERFFGIWRCTFLQHCAIGCVNRLFRYLEGAKKTFEKSYLWKTTMFCMIILLFLIVFIRFLVKYGLFRDSVGTQNDSWAVSLHLEKNWTFF